MRFLLLFIFLATSLALFSQDLNWIDFEDQIRVQESCPGSIARGSIDYLFIDEDTITIKILSTNLLELRGYYGGRLVDLAALIVLSGASDFKKFEIEFRIDGTEEDAQISVIQYNKDQERVKDLKIKFACFYVRSSNPRIKISDSCNEKVDLFFPFAGTQTDLYLSKQQEDGTFERIFSNTYYCCSWGNSYHLASTEKGKYRVKLVGCHVTDSFEFTII